jgi:hypothetical protein
MISNPESLSSQFHEPSPIGRRDTPFGKSSVANNSSSTFMYSFLTAGLISIFGFQPLQTPPYAGERRPTNSTSLGFHGEDRTICISRACEDHEFKNCGIHELRMRQAVHSASPVTEQIPADRTNVVFDHDDPMERDPWGSTENDGVAVLVPKWHFPVGTGAHGPWQGAASALVATGEIRSVTCCDLDEFSQVTPKNRRIFSAITSNMSSVPPTKKGAVARENTQMIDTIGGRALVALDSNQVSRLQRNELIAWTSKFTGRVHSHSQEWVGAYSADHKETKMHVVLKDNKLEWVACSLPRLLGQPNGIQLKSPADLHRARAAFATIIQTLMPRTANPDIELNRLDLVLNLHLDPRMVLALHQFARHPRIRRETKLYYNEHPGSPSKSPPHQCNSLSTVVFDGKQIRIVMYDKPKEVCGRKGKWPDRSSSVRVEIQLKEKKSIAKVLGFSDRESVTLHELCFERCYRVYRELLLEFEQVAKMPDFGPKTATFLAILQQFPETWGALGGVEPLAWYRASKGISEKSFRDVSSKVRKHRLQLHEFRWADHLPEDRLPDVVDVDADGNETLVPSFTAFPRNDREATVW